MDDKHKTQDVSGVENPEVGHEKRDVNLRIVVGFGLALTIAAIVIHLFVWVLFDVFGRFEAQSALREFPLAQTSEVRLPPSPRLQDKPREDLKALRRHEDELLNSYTWLNQQTGAVRVPINEAMKRVVQQGFPVAEQPAAPGAPAPGESSSGRTLEPPVKR